MQVLYNKSANGVQPNLIAKALREELACRYREQLFNHERYNLPDRGYIMDMLLLACALLYLLYKRTKLIKINKRRATRYGLPSP